MIEINNYNKLSAMKLYRVLKFIIDKSEKPGGNMPFFQPFKTYLESEDLVYGLNTKRNEYAIKYPAFCHLRDKSHFSIIDRYSITPEEIEMRKCFGTKIPPNQEKFTKSIENHHKYKVLQFAMKDNRTSKFDIDWNKKCISYTKKVTKRKCKAGLSWYSLSLNHSCIHFILDGIDMESVIYKHYEKKMKKGTSYTGSELRWIYRNRKDPKVKSCIQFWRNGQPVFPPWVEGKDAHLWQDYQPKFENTEIEVGEFAETVLNL
ncbi:hypothetical protein [Xenorhabdus anantnagensis]|uniref:T3SS effector EspK n=1 Tax=Xenorhabdus anantnagensis TaxID=3025875 RepID=A0ABT5LPF1_9GAMM|nr:hypothetical protein [Xenorhabdus anantnagensis]MDC9596277.1 hypothetical protein [Xenorhabdus anantnagensis]